MAGEKKVRERRGEEREQRGMGQEERGKRERETASFLFTMAHPMTLSV